MSLQRSERARKAKSVFYRQFNDVDIYVEDTGAGTSKLYARIFERVLGGTFRVDTVFPLGGKDVVIKNCTNDQEDGGRLRLYVIDGDLELLTDTNPKGLKRLLVLDKYCLENYLIDEDAIISVLDEEELDKTRAQLHAEFALEEWIRENETGLFDLFVLYAIARSSNPSCATVSYPVNKLISSDCGILDPQKLSKRKLEIEEQILTVMSREELKEKIKSVVSICTTNGRSRLSCVSGKDYLFPLISIRMRKATKIRANNNVIKQRLALRCDLSELSQAYSLIAQPAPRYMATNPSQS